MINVCLNYDLIALENQNIGISEHATKSCNCNESQSEWSHHIGETNIRFKWSMWGPILSNIRVCDSIYCGLDRNIRPKAYLRSYNIGSQYMNIKRPIHNVIYYNGRWRLFDWLYGGPFLIASAEIKRPNHRGIVNVAIAIEIHEWSIAGMWGPSKDKTKNRFAPSKLIQS